MNATTPVAAPAPRPDAWYHFVLLTLCGGILFLSVVLTVQHGTQVVIPFVGQPLPELCFLRRYLALDCPGCGLTRCFISLGHGDVPAAWSYNPAGLLLFAVIAFQIPFRAIQLWRIRAGRAELETGYLAAAVWGAFATLLFAQWGLRLVGLTF